MATTTQPKQAAGFLASDEVRQAVAAFTREGGLGTDPIAAFYTQRRADWSLFSSGLRDEEIEAMRSYILPYDSLPSRPDDMPLLSANLINGVWQAPSNGNLVTLNALWDRRVPLTCVADSQAEDVELAVAGAWDYWSSLDWADEVTTYRKYVINNLSRILEYYREEMMLQIRHLIPKTKLEAEKDFWEGKRAADHIGGNAEKALKGELVPTMVAGHRYWKNAFIPAGISAVITPMNFIYGIPLIQIVGAYMSGSPFIYKGHPFAGIANTTMIRALLAAGADPRAVYKLEGFGAGISTLATHEKVSVVSLTGSEQTARAIATGRGVRTLRFEGGGCNWSWIDDGFSDEELTRIAVRLAYSKLGFSSHKCTTLHGVCASESTLKRLVALINAEMDQWAIADPRKNEHSKVIGPNMVHQAQTVDQIQAAAKAAGYQILREGGKVSGSDYADHAEVIRPVIIGGLSPESYVEADWDGKGVRRFNLTTTEFFMPILCAMALPDFDSFLRFCLLTNSHDLACSLWTRDDRKLERARHIIGGMLKENDGTDSAMDWEEFGASGIGDSGNMGVGDAETTVGIYSRRQKGRHVIF